MCCLHVTCQVVHARPSLLFPAATAVSVAALRVIIVIMMVVMLLKALEELPERCTGYKPSGLSLVLA
jgi:predicted transcriptional regulator